MSPPHGAIVTELDLGPDPFCNRQEAEACEIDWLGTGVDEDPEQHQKLSCFQMHSGTKPIYKPCAQTRERLNSCVSLLTGYSITARTPSAASRHQQPTLSSKHLNSYSLPIRRGGMPDARSGARLLGEAKAYAVASPPAEDAAADRIILVQLTRKASGALPSLTPRHSRSTRVQRLHVPLYSTSI